MIELLELSRVLDAVQTTGTEVRYYDQRCQTAKVAGFYRIGPGVDELVICPSNQHNHSDLFDTIRHEATHVAQACNGGPILPYDYLLERSTDEINRSLSFYPQDRHTQHMELEAHIAAEFLNEEDVIDLINTYCFE